MCGIAGFIDFSHQSTPEILRSMTDVLHHRGPDDSGLEHGSVAAAEVGLGHRRLSILDLSPGGHQPMHFDHLTIVYNGEVYNFREIAKELEKEGYRFDSHSDTEVILKAFHRWGNEALKRFNGMFALALLDRKNNTLSLIRDRSGVKPLYWYRHDNLFLFASELKSFHEHPLFRKDLNTDAIALFLEHQYIPQPHTIFQNCYKLPPAHIMKIDLTDQHIKTERYWDIVEHYNKPKLQISEEEALEELDTLMHSAFTYRMVADVPVGIFLSGGYDSSIVTAILQKESSRKLKTFTIGFHENGFDESKHALAVAEYLGTEHTSYYCTQQDALEIIPKLCEIYDEPFADSSAIPTLLVSHLAREQVTVSLSADGGDEIFGGYESYERTLRYYKLFQNIPPPMRTPLSRLLSGINPRAVPFLRSRYNIETRFRKITDILQSGDIIEAFRITGAYMTEREANRLLKKDASELQTAFTRHTPFANHVDTLEKMLAIDYQTYMADDILTKVDRATMHVSLEGREPMLDHRIVEYAARLPSSLKYRDGTKKYLLRKLAHTYLPEKIMNRPKMGFGVPIYAWFQKELKSYFLHYLDAIRLEKQGIFNTAEVIRLRDAYLDGKSENVEKLWSILVFQMWHERWMEETRP